MVRLLSTFSLRHSHRLICCRPCPRLLRCKTTGDVKFVQVRSIIHSYVVYSPYYYYTCILWFIHHRRLFNTIRYDRRCTQLVLLIALMLIFSLLQTSRLYTHLLSLRHVTSSRHLIVCTHDITRHAHSQHPHQARTHVLYIYPISLAKEMVQ